MKKNMMMRLASVLLVATLLSTCAISGTFAKYVTQATGTDSARVAKFGVTITANGETFAKEYDADDTATAIAQTVVSTNKVVAPGTEGALASMTLTGTPEVAVKVTYAADLVLTGWEVDSAPYCPIVFNVAGTEIKMGGSITTTAQLETAVEEAISAYTKEYAVDTDLSTVAADSLDITWAWAYFTSAENDVKDTALGNQATAGSAATISLTITTTVTQID